MMRFCLGVVTFGSEPWFEPEPTRTGPRFGPRFVSRVEPNQWCGSRITSDYKNRFEPERTFSFPGEYILCVIRHNLKFNLLFTLYCADHTFGVSMYLGSCALRKHDRQLPTNAPTPHNRLNQQYALSIRISRLQSPCPLTTANSSWLRLKS